MENQIETIAYEGQEVRVVKIEEKVWCVGKDIAKLLGYTNPQKAIRDHVKEEDKKSWTVETKRGKQSTKIINEQGLYNLVLKSKLPKAEEIKDWILKQVTPTLGLDSKILEPPKDSTNIFSSELKGVRTFTLDGKPWFVGRDVAKILGYKDTVNALKDHVDPEDKRILKAGQNDTHSFTLNRDLTIINESGLYSLIFESKLPAAEKFKHWITSEVLPSIHKTGQYQAPQVNPYMMIEDSVERVIRWVEDHEKEIQAINSSEKLEMNLEPIG